MNKIWYFRTEEGAVYGPADVDSLIKWAEEGRIEPTGTLSRDRINWTPVQLMKELEMKWLVEAEPGKVFGPFNRAVVIRLAQTGSLPKGANVYRLHELPVDKDPDPVVVEKVVEKEVRVEVPVEKIVEKIVEKEVRVEVPVEKIVERVVEVEKPARTAFVVPEVVEAIDEAPPKRVSSGIFKGADIDRLAALESAARQELARAGGMKFGIFGRKRQ